MKVIIGLGNPGSKYEETRHNIGFKIIDSFANRYFFPSFKKDFHAFISSGSIHHQDVSGQNASHKIIVVKPQTFMNLSGKTVQSMKTFYKLQIEDMIIVHDELSLPFATLRCKRNGGHAGHNGLRDISSKIGTNYHRLRFGIGRPPAGWDTASYVLAKWTKNENDALVTNIDRAVDMLHSWCFDGIEKTMNSFHQQ